MCGNVPAHHECVQTLFLDDSCIGKRLRITASMFGGAGVRQHVPPLGCDECCYVRRLHARQFHLWCGGIPSRQDTRPHNIAKSSASHGASRCREHMYQNGPSECLGQCEQAKSPKGAHGWKGGAHRRRGRVRSLACVAQTAPGSLPRCGRAAAVGTGVAHHVTLAATVFWGLGGRDTSCTLVM